MRSEGSPAGKAKGATPKPPPMAAVTMTSGPGATSSEIPSVLPMASSPVPPGLAATSSTSATTSSAPALEVPEAEVKQLLMEANAMLKEMRQLKMLALSSTQVENMAVGHGCHPSSGRTGLLDSGASHPFRTATEEAVGGWCGSGLGAEQGGHFVGKALK